MKLYIIGNGFDCHHGLKTTYNHYRDYLKNNWPQVFFDYDKFPYLANLDSPWADIEKALMIDYISLMEDRVSYAYPEGFRTSKGTWLNIDIDLEKSTEFINGFTGEYFAKWLKSIDFDNVITDLSLSQTDVYLNFNYTDTLQIIYDIPENNVCHIHGRLINLKGIDTFHVRKELQFGAVGISAEEVEEKLNSKYNDYWLSSLFIKPAIFVLSEFVKKSTKDLTKNFDKLKKFLLYKEISEIVIMGHRLDSADLEYYSNILIPRYHNNLWTFYRYGGDKSSDSLMINKFIERFDLKNTRILDW